MREVIPFPAQSIHREPDLPNDLRSPPFLRVLAIITGAGLWLAIIVVAFEVFRP